MDILGFIEVRVVVVTLHLNIYIRLLWSCVLLLREWIRRETSQPRNNVQCVRFSYARAVIETILIMCIFSYNCTHTIPQVRQTICASV